MEKETIEEAKERIIKENIERKQELSKKLKRYPAKNEEYRAFIDELKALITEGEFTARWTMLETYHEVGRLIVDSSHCDVPCERIAEDLEFSVQTIQRAIRFYKKFPDINTLPRGKAISWHYVVHKLLPEGKERPERKLENRPEVVDWIICPFCQGHFNRRTAKKD